MQNFSTTNPKFGAVYYKSGPQWIERPSYEDITSEELKGKFDGATDKFAAFVKGKYDVNYRLDKPLAKVLKQEKMWVAGDEDLPHSIILTDAEARRFKDANEEDRVHLLNKWVGGDIYRFKGDLRVNEQKDLDIIL